MIPLTIDSSNWKDTTDSSSAQFKEFESYGPRYCKLENVKISSVSYNEATATLGSLSFPLYYAYVGEDSSISSQIRSKLNSYKNSGDSVTIYGYVNAFINNYNTRVRILLRDPNAIIGPETPVSVSSIAVSNATTTFTKDSEFMEEVSTYGKKKKYVSKANNPYYFLSERNEFGGLMRDGSMMIYEGEKAKQLHILNG